MDLINDISTTTKKVEMNCLTNKFAIELCAMCFGFDFEQ